MSNELANLLTQARWALDLASQGDLGELLGSSRRTGQRWEAEGSTPRPDQLHKLAALVFPRDASLAALVAHAGGSTLEQLGIVAPPPPPPGPPPPPDPIHLVDTVVCAAADAMSLTPEAVRPALRAAFRRAKLAGLSLEEVDDALHGKGRGQGDAPAAVARPKESKVKRRSTT